MDAQKVFKAIEDNPSFLSEYAEANEKEFTQFIVDNFDVEDVVGWLERIKKRVASIRPELRKVDFLKKENGKQHRTDEYESSQLVVRRSATFDLNVIFRGRAYDPNRDNMFLQFGLGKTPTKENGTLFECKLEKENNSSPYDWSSHIVSNDTDFKKLRVRVNIPANAPVARYQFFLGIESNKKLVTSKRNDVLVIFNPFSQKDDVYMQSSAEIEEYVLNEVGFIGTGSADKQRKKEWFFNQFEPHVLDIAFELLNSDPRAKTNKIKNWKNRSSPVYCCRLLSAMINSNGDDGVLSGNWSGDYSNGKSPTYWTGSVTILKKWFENKISVNFGQCWVYSGVFTTLLRTLGIPSRSVTNYNSGHDSRNDVTIDKYVYEDPANNSDHESDSIWNFHVWNEAFFRRPNLPDGYDGWQAIDATPQEKSKERMQCGPAPVKAIKEGDIRMPFDSAFIFGEVNADVAYWHVNEEDKVVGLLRRNTSHVGKAIVTKAVGKNEMVDITDQYKYPEGSDKERAVYSKAFGLGAGYDDNRKVAKPSDLEIKIDMEKTPVYGEDAVFTFQVTNKGQINRNVRVRCTVSAKGHDGYTGVGFFVMTKTMELNKLQGYKFERTMLYHDYKYGLNGEQAGFIQATILDVKNNEFVLAEHTFDMDMPDLFNVNVKSLEPGERAYKFELENKFPFRLTKGVIGIEGRGVKTNEIVLKKALEPGEKREIEINVKVPETRYIYHGMSFQSTEVKNINHAERIKVEFY